MKIGNRRLWVNAAIQAFRAELEVIRLEHMAGRDGDAIDSTNNSLRSVMDKFDEQMKHRPFTEKKMRRMNQMTA